MKASSRGPRKSRLLGGAVLLLCLSAGIPARCETIYYQKNKDGSIRLTNAPDGPGYHTFLSTGRYPSSGGASSGLYAEPIGRAASRYGVDPALVRAVIAAESNFNPRAVSPKGARGLMQLMPSTARRFGVKDIHDPLQNIEGGVQYLRHLLDLFEGDLVLALAAYNAGEGVVQGRGRVPDYRETREYVDRVLTRYGRGGVGAGSASAGRKLLPATAPAKQKAPIYRTVSSEGALVFSDSPVRRPVND